jgi:hypothetical protein
MRTPDIRTLLLRATAGGALWWTVFQAAPARSQQPSEMEVMAARVDRMQRQLDATERELEEYRSALASLRQQVQAMSPAGAEACKSGGDGDVTTLRQAVADLREEQTVQQSEIAVHEQAKVETPSRYNLRVGGLVLFNAFEDAGVVDSIDVPAIALARPAGTSHGANGASLRQSMITLDATGPRFWGAHTYANVQVDFFGGLSTADYTSTAGTVRMRSASILTEWPSWRVHAGLERLLISQGSPTSYATIAEPAMAWSGNLWAWVPQLAVEKSWPVSDSSRFSLAGAVADIPDPGPGDNPYLRKPSAAEQSRYPGSEGRFGFAWGANHASSIGVDGYFSPHDYGQSGNLDAWASLVDWNFALPAKFALSGEAYRGQALGGLGGGAFKDMVTAYSYAQQANGLSKAMGLHDAGGWAQLKYRPRNWVEFNGAYGQDGDLASQLRAAYFAQTGPYSGLARNQTVLANTVFRPRASFLLSLEYRRLRSWQLTSAASEAQIFGIAAGYEF